MQIWTLESVLSECVCMRVCARVDACDAVLGEGCSAGPGRNQSILPDPRRNILEACTCANNGKETQGVNKFKT